MHSLLHCTCGSKHKECVYVILRVVTGFIFFFHGYAKVFGMGMEQTAGFFASVGIPAAGFFAWVVAYGELIGGLMLMAGLLTHWVSKFNIGVMLGAIWFVHLANGFNAMNGGYEFQLLLLVVSVYLMVGGSGKWSLDKVVFKEKSTMENVADTVDQAL